MDRQLPLSRLVLAARSAADDLSFVALHDVAAVLSEQPAIEHRLIGAHMVSFHAHRWGLGAELYRETRDVDFGVPLEAAKNPRIVERLEALGYGRSAGNRMVRPVTDLPARTQEPVPVPEAAVDILVPAYTSRPRTNIRLGDHLTTTEVPGLAEAFRRDAVEVKLELARLNGETMSAQLLLPDEVSMVILRSLIWKLRGADTDGVDLWRSLEIAVKAGVRPSDFAVGAGLAAAAAVRSAFVAPGSSGGEAVAQATGVSGDAAVRLRTRLAALTNRVVGEAS